MSVALRRRDAGRELGRSEAQKRGSEPAAAWLTLAAVLAVWLVALTPLGRAMEWDESVFFTQAADLPGVDAPPTRFQASREHGPVLLIGAARLVAGDLAGIRSVYLMVSFLLVLLAYRVAGRQAGRWSGLVGAALFSTFWIPTFFFSAFFGPLLGAAAALLTTGLYLRLRSEPISQAVHNGLLIGPALALAFAFRNLETALVVAVLGAHAVLWRPADLLRRWRGVLAAIVAFTGIFIIPWTWYTIAEWGSVRARWISARTQTNTEGDQGHPFSLHNGADEYLRLLVGVDGFYQPAAPVPGWVVGVVSVGMFALSAAVLALLVRRVLHRYGAGAQQPGQSAHIVLFVVLSAASFGLFFFLSELIRERYLHHGLIFGAVAAGQALVTGHGWLRHRLPRGARQGTLVLTVCALVWLSAQAWMAMSIQERRYQVTNARAEVGTLVAALAEGRPCRIAGAISRPNVQVTSGCEMTAFRGRHAPADGRFDGDVVFVAWDPTDPRVPGFVHDWPRVEARSLHGMVLSYGVPPR